MCPHDTTVLREINGQLAGIDACIAPLVDALNAAGLRTVASCCGHGHRPGIIALADGRELLIIPNYAAARRLDRLIGVDIWGEPLLPRMAEGQGFDLEPARAALAQARRAGEGG